MGYGNISQPPASMNSFTSPAFVIQNSRIGGGDYSINTTFLQEATHILNMYHQECRQKLLLLQKEKDFEL